MAFKVQPLFASAFTEVEDSHITKKELAKLVFVNTNGPKNKLIKLREKLLKGRLCQEASDLYWIIMQLEEFQKKAK